MLASTMNFTELLKDYKNDLMMVGKITLILRNNLNVRSRIGRLQSSNLCSIQVTVAGRKNEIKVKQNII